MSVAANPAAFLKDLFYAGLAAADPLKTVPAHLPPRPRGRVVVVGAGKAAGAMAQAVEQAWPDVDLSGHVVTQYGYARPAHKIEVVEAAHPVPDDAGEAACRRMFEILNNLRADDLVLGLFSGGGSALLSLPAPGISSAEKRAINKALVLSGAPIHKINCVRKHLSAIKGGRLGAAAGAAQVVSLIISDVPGDDPRVVASGPALPDPGTQAEALEILEAYKIPFSQAVRDWLTDPANETPKPGDPRFANNTAKIVSRGRDMLEAAAVFAQQAGVASIMLGECEGEARELGALHAREALKHVGQGPCVLISGGEATVTVRGKGRGGRSTEYLLGAALEAAGNAHIWGLACATDGRDGSGDNAGGFFAPEMLALAKSKGIDAQASLAENDTYNYFAGTGGLIITGPTCTNVNDLRALLVL